MRVCSGGTSKGATRLPRDDDDLNTRRNGREYIHVRCDYQNLIFHLKERWKEEGEQRKGRLRNEGGGWRVEARSQD
jgi:hypothetical protein